MRLETFRGKDLARVSQEARSVLGEDCMIVRTSVVRSPGANTYEIVAATYDDVTRFASRLAAPLPSLPSSVGGRGSSGPLVVALVGPTGAGKTTTAAKLAVNPLAFGDARVGLLALDTYRVGAIEQLQTYAEIASLPLEIIYSAQEVPDAMHRLIDCDVVLVDTPGRSPRAAELNAEWREMLLAANPDETHLVLPASIRADIALSVRQAFASFGATHLLLTKLDEVPGEIGVADLASRLDLPLRWITDGQEVPTDLGAARPRLLGALGLAHGLNSAPVLAHA